MTNPAVATVQRQYDAYHARDAEAYADDCVVSNLNGLVTLSGAAAIRERYAEIFASHPHNRSKLLNRIALGDVVIDHEHVERAPGGSSFQGVAIYTVQGDRISRVDFIKQAC
ncbi:MAG TPA: nuclear transport factor 2 family protein [Pseudolabrys sp.]|nr:nuclear transport factor 2 family protein [Pseudolabrys sp.]